MIRPNEMKLELPMQVVDGMSTTCKVWEILMASREGNLEKVKGLVDETPGLIYAQYNYTPPIHFAVREGHIDLVKYLLDNGALDPTYRIYPFLDNLLTIAQDREYHDIVTLLENYLSDSSLCKFEGDNGKIYYKRSELEKEFEDGVGKADLDKTEQLLKNDPKLALEKTFFWGEGILMRPAKEENYKLVDLLMSYGARVPSISKWAQFYYFEKAEMAAYLLEKGMNPNHMSWHHVTLLHDMAQKGDIQKAELLIKRGAEVNPLEEEYHSTPLGMAARWGHTEMVKFLLEYGADPNKASATWSTPLKWARKKGHEEIEDILRKAGAQ